MTRNRDGLGRDMSVDCHAKVNAEVSEQRPAVNSLTAVCHR